MGESIDQNNETSQDIPPRRSFLTILWGILGLAAVAELGWLVVSFLRPREKASAAGSFGVLIEAGAVGTFAPGSVTAFPRGRFYLARLEDGGFLALSRQCTHLGCTVPWSEDKNRFQCPCHASVYDIRGEVVRPPAPRALDLYAVNIENNVVWVDTRKMKERNSFDKAQVTYPKG